MTFGEWRNASSDGLSRPLRLSVAIGLRGAFRGRQRRRLTRLTDPVAAGALLLQAGALAVLGGESEDASRWLTENPWPELPLSAGDWGTRVWSTVFDAWLRLIRQQGPADLDAVIDGAARLRGAQREFERPYLEAQEPGAAKTAALELIGLYHLVRAAEILALHIQDGAGHTKVQVEHSLRTQFHHARTICQHGQMLDLELISRLLAAAALHDSGPLRDS